MKRPIALVTMLSALVAQGGYRFPAHYTYVPLNYAGFGMSGSSDQPQKVIVSGFHFSRTYWIVAIILVVVGFIALALILSFITSEPCSGYPLCG